MNKTLKFVVPFLVLGSGVLASFLLVQTGPDPSRTAALSSPPLVEVVEPKLHTGPVQVEAMGEVVPAREVVIQPEVSGKLVWVSPKLVPGGSVRTGELLARIEPADYELALARAKAALVQAKRDLAVEKGRARVAAKEWELSKVNGATEEGRRLALRLPHLQGAEAGLKSARSGLEQARLRLDRTRIRAPFDAFVQDESAELGTQVTPQSRLATLVGSQVAWIQASISVGSLGWIEVPGLGTTRGSLVTVDQEIGDGQSIRRTGRVIRLLRELDPLGRMARLLIAVAHPFRVNGKNGLPLLLGAFVRLSIHGRSQENLFVLPRKAVRDGDRVLLVDDAGRLFFQRIDLVQGLEGEVLVQSGVGPGDRVVTSPLARASGGMVVRVSTPPTQADLQEPECEDPAALAKLQIEESLP